MSVSCYNGKLFDLKGRCLENVKDANLVFQGIVPKRFQYNRIELLGKLLSSNSLLKRPTSYQTVVDQQLVHYCYNYQQLRFLDNFPEKNANIDLNSGEKCAGDNDNEFFNHNEDESLYRFTRNGFKSYDSDYDVDEYDDDGDMSFITPSLQPESNRSINDSNISSNCSFDSSSNDSCEDVEVACWESRKQALPIASARYLCFARSNGVDDCQMTKHNTKIDVEFHHEVELLDKQNILLKIVSEDVNKMTMYGEKHYWIQSVNGGNSRSGKKLVNDMRQLFMEYKSWWLELFQEIFLITSILFFIPIFVLLHLAQRESSRIDTIN